MWTFERDDFDFDLCLIQVSAAVWRITSDTFLMLEESCKGDGGQSEAEQG